jgi:hypothetical protein
MSTGSDKYYRHKLDCSTMPIALRKTKSRTRAWINKRISDDREARY